VTSSWFFLSTLKYMWWERTVGSECIWLSIGTGVGILWKRNLTFRCFKIRWISWQCWV